MVPTDLIFFFISDFDLATIMSQSLSIIFYRSLSGSLVFFNVFFHKPMWYLFQFKKFLFSFKLLFLSLPVFLSILFFFVNVFINFCLPCLSHCTSLTVNSRNTHNIKTSTGKWSSPMFCSDSSVLVSSLIIVGFSIISCISKTIRLLLQWNGRTCLTMKDWADICSAVRYHANFTLIWVTLHLFKLSMH